MRRYLVVLAAAAVCVTGRVAAQVSVEDVRTDKQDRVFENDIKTQQVGADYYSEARYRAERAAIRKERNALEFTSNLQGSLTAFSESWQASGDNAIAILANVNFKHVFTKGAFSITTAAVAKFGYNRMKAEFTDEAGAKYEEGVWFKNVDEISISTSPQWKMTKNWSYGTIIKFRTQFAEGYSARTDKRNSKAPISNFMAPGYLDISGGFTYTLPSERFPLKVNLAPIALSAVYVEDDFGVEPLRRQGGQDVEVRGRFLCAARLRPYMGQERLAPLPLYGILVLRLDNRHIEQPELRPHAREG